MFKYVIYKGNFSKLQVTPVLESRGNWTEASEKDAKDFKAEFIWTPVVFPKKVLVTQIYRKLDGFPTKSRALHVHNHLENISLITTKPGLVKCLRQFYAQVNGYSLFDSMPTSFTLRAHIKDTEFTQFLTRHKELRLKQFTNERLPPKHCIENLWLVKPAALNQGRGIEICKALPKIKQLLDSKPIHSVWVVQKYIERPLLFKGRKFDIRVLALMTAKHDLFYYKQGYLRTSSSEYVTNTNQPYVHLTNQCLQKHGEAYGVYEDGNTLSFSEFQEYLDEVYGTVSFIEHLLPRIKDLMIDVFRASTHLLHQGKRNRVFELVGFDFLIDEDFRVWLIEANTNPYLGTPNEFIKELIPKMLDDLLAITVDPFYPPTVPRDLDTNEFELIYSEGKSRWAQEAVNTRSPYHVIYPFTQEQRAQQLEALVNEKLEDVHGVLGALAGLKQRTLVPETESKCKQALKLLCGDSFWALNLLYALPEQYVEDFICQFLRPFPSQIVNISITQWLIANVLDSTQLQLESIEALQTLVKTVPPEQLLNSRVLFTLFYASQFLPKIKSSVPAHYWQYLVGFNPTVIPVQLQNSALLTELTDLLEPSLKRLRRPATRLQDSRPRTTERTPLHSRKSTSVPKSRTVRESLEENKVSPSPKNMLKPRFSTVTHSQKLKERTDIKDQRSFSTLSLHHLQHIKMSKAYMTQRTKFAKRLQSKRNT